MTVSPRLAAARRIAGAALIAAAIGACTPRGAMLQPAPAGLAAAPATATAVPSNVVLVIYSAGSRQEYLPDRCEPRGATTPPVVRALAGSRVAGMRVAVYAACTQHRVGEFNDRTRAGTPKVDLRASDIEHIVQRFERLGIPPRHILLAGHSAGGWASLRAVRDGAPAVAGVIAFAPAFAGPIRTRSAGWQWIRDVEAGQLAHTRALPALVFAFADDAFEPPEDLAFLAGVPGVQVVQVPDDARDGGPCEGVSAHRAVFGPCFADAWGPRIRAFIGQRLAAVHARNEQSAR